MRQQYLLPCSCGQETRVEATQAGQTIKCSCGGELEVPTFRKLGELERAERPKAPTQKQSSWGARQAVFLLGALIVLVGLGMIGFLYYQWPRIPPIEDLSAIESWATWHHELSSGVDQRPWWEEGYQEGVKFFKALLTLAGAVAGIGAVVMFSSFLIPKKGSRRRRSPAAGPPQQRRPADS